MTHRLPDASVGRFPSAWMRLLILCTGLLGINYITWRWMASLNWSAWWIAVPLILAETYSVIDSLLFAFGAWKLRERGEPPTAPTTDVTVDVFITTYDEPVDLVMRTTLAAKAIRYPHSTWILDDGNRADMRAAAEQAGLGVVTRGQDWVDLVVFYVALVVSVLASLAVDVVVLMKMRVPSASDVTLPTDPEVGDRRA